ncbi:MAG: nitrogen fixation protein NifZ [Parvibaculum sp.]|nr:nitrogen fixation protein NifZ [Parvibaculum sp.]
MIEPRFPIYQWGQRVVALIDLRNDGTFPEAPAEALLVPAGAAGEIVQVGTHTDSSTPIYLVEFGERLVVGCLEEEIVPIGQRVGHEGDRDEGIGGENATASE